MARKKNDLNKRRTNLARGLLRLYKVAIVRLGEEQIAINWGNLRPVYIGHQLAKDINELNHEWVVTLVAICRVPGGRKYFKAEEVAPPYPCRSDRITDSIHAQADALRSECNVNHFLRMAWIATPYSYSFTDEQIDRLMEDLDAWDEVTMLQPLPETATQECET